MEDFNISYKSKAINVLQYAEYVLRGPESDKSSDYGANIEALNDYRQRNFMKVDFNGGALENCRIREFN